MFPGCTGSWKWSLITEMGGGGGLQNEMGRGGSEVLPLQKGKGREAGKVLAMLKVGHKKF